MSTLKRSMFGLLVVMASVGCSSMNATSMRMGKVYPSLPAGCPVRFENADYNEASAKYEQVGLVTLSGTSKEPQAWEGVTKQQLEPKVCEIGGQIVTMNGASSGQAVMGMGTGMIQFAV